MTYKYARKCNYEKYASWGVLYNKPWSTWFPVRLLDEIRCRTKVLLGKNDIQNKLRVYDPCWWIWYMLTVLWFLHWIDISEILVSDIDAESVTIAKKNLSLLSFNWIQKRIIELQTYIDLYNKVSHKKSKTYAQEIKSEVVAIQHIVSDCSVLDIAKISKKPKEKLFDVIICDIPYGKMTQWWGHSTINNLFVGISHVMHEHSIFVLITPKIPTPLSLEFKKVDSFQVWKRKILFFQKK